MACAGCRQTRGLAGGYGPEGGAWLDCFVQRLGFPAGTKWTAEVHRAVFEAASVNIDMRGSLTAEQMKAEAFGSNPSRAAEIAANLPTGLWHDDGDQFWSCLGVTKVAAVAAMNSKSGRYWNMLVAAGQRIFVAEGGRVPSRPRGSLVGAVVVLGLGTALLEWFGGRR